MFHYLLEYKDVIQATVGILTIAGFFLTAFIQIKTMKHTAIKERKDKLWNGASSFLNDVNQMRISYSSEGGKDGVEKSIYESMKLAIENVSSQRLSKTPITSDVCLRFVRDLSWLAPQDYFDVFIVNIFDQWKYKQHFVGKFSVEMFLVFLECVQSLLESIMYSKDISDADKRFYALSILSSLKKEEMYILMLFGLHSENRGVEKAFLEAHIYSYILPDQGQEDIITSIIVGRYWHDKPRI